jgi:hypothetical protein
MRADGEDELAFAGQGLNVVTLAEAVMLARHDPADRVGGVDFACDTKSHVVSELVKGGSTYVEDVASGRCSTCPHRNVRGRFLIGRVRSLRERPRAAVPTMAVTGKGKGRYGATTRKLSQMLRHNNISGWEEVPGW